MLKRIIATIVLGAGLGLGACGRNPAADQPAAPSAPAQSNLAAPKLSADAAPAAAQPVVLPTLQPGVYTTGAFTARIERAALRMNRWGQLQANITMTLFNTGTEPMSVLLLDSGRMSLALPNGMTIGSDGSSLHACRDNDLAECRLRYAAEYAQIDPSGFVSVNVWFESNNLSAAEQASVRAVATGSLAGRLHLIQGDSVDRSVQLSFPNFPLSNETAQ